MGKLTWILSEICCSLQQGRDFTNRSRFDKVIAIVRLAEFCDSQCRIAMKNWKNRYAVITQSRIDRFRYSLVHPYYMPMTIQRWKAKPEVELQYGGRLFSETGSSDISATKARRSEAHIKMAKINFVTSKAVDIMTTAYYIKGRWCYEIDFLPFCVCVTECWVLHIMRFTYLLTNLLEGGVERISTFLNKAHQGIPLCLCDSEKNINKNICARLMMISILPSKLPRTTSCCQWHI